MFYTIYKITNTVNGKHYIGKHQTKDLDDGYFGSGKLLKYAIKKYGLDNFHKEIIKICSSEKEMNLLEKILVVPDPEISYNLCPGGQGGMVYPMTHEGRIKREANLKSWYTSGNKSTTNKFYSDIDYRLNQINHLRKISNLGITESRIKNPNGTFYGKTHTGETKKKISKGAIKRLGNNNGSFGTCWITNGQENRKIKKDELDIWLEKGYYKGRIALLAQRQRQRS